ncbi:MAG: aldo/keto reductase [Lachnospiraceae bacterium]|nr:aldo/keto reductase [Lachnospiraceae bacterium]
MQYRENKQGEQLSVLGYGCMRFSRKGNGIDLEKAQKELQVAIEGGVNYFDTAYVYAGSEAALGAALENLNCREKVNIATKLPHYLIKSIEGCEKLFQEELKRLRTTYVDYYLMHMLDDVETWEKLCALGIKEWIAQKKESGAIRHIGFSYHGNTENFKALIDAYDWDFCQIQYNYMDEHSQAGREGLQYAASQKIPVVIMEPLRGGRLVGMLPEKAKELLKKEPHHRSPAEWGLKWLYDQPEVTVVLSGMNSEEMVRENMRVASETLPHSLSEEEKQVIEQIKEIIAETVKVGCTGCRYCMPCPFGVDIPETFRCYNAVYSESKRGAQHEYLQCTTFRKTPTDASLCRECGKCEEHCPQHIPIRAELKNARKALESPLFHLTKFAVKHLRLWG